MKTLRLFAILDRLRSAAAPVSAEALAAMLEVSTRTIYRDMVALQALGAPIRGESGLGYQLEKGYFLPPLHFTPDELDAIKLGVRLVEARGDDDLVAAARNVAGKIGATLAQAAQDGFATLPLRAVSLRTQEVDKAGLHLPLLRRSIRSAATLELRYRDLQGSITNRIVRPLGLTLFDAIWLLTAWCETSNGFRNFRLDRIARAAVTGLTFRHANGRRFADYLATL